MLSPETSVNFQRTTHRYIPEDATLDNHRWENLKAYSQLVEKFREMKRKDVHIVISVLFCANFMHHVHRARNNG
jgi:hypothetical protein